MTRQTPALVFLFLVAVAFLVWFLFKPDPQGNAMRTREIATRGLAEYLTRVHSGKRALIISNPFTQRKDTAKAIVDMEQAGIRGLREGFGDKITIRAVAFPELKAGANENPRALLADAETTTPLSYLVAADAFDKLAKQHGDCEIIASLIGLPLELNRCETWNAAGGSKFALLLPDFRGIADATTVQKAMKSGKLLAFVLVKPGAPDDDSAPGKNWKAEFEKRFVLVTAENVDQVTQAYPELF